MTLCSRCGRSAADAGEKTDGLCDLCRTKESQAPEGASAGISTGWRSEQQKKFDALREALSSVIELRCELSPDISEQPSTQAQKRAYARHEVSLPFQFWFLRDLNPCQGELLDISQGGIRFQSTRELVEGQHLRVVIERPSGGRKIEMVKSLVEVRRVVVNESGVFIVGACFIKRSGFDHKDRRHYPRHQTNTDVFYQRAGSVFISRGDAFNISQGGLAMRCSEEISLGEVITVQLRTTPPAMADADIEGDVSVVRVRPRGRGRCDVGCSFTRIQVVPVEEQSAEAAE